MNEDAFEVYDLAQRRAIPDNYHKINAIDSEGSTALHLALDPFNAFFDESIIQTLIEKGSNVNAIDKYGSTPLHNYSCSDDINALIIDDLLQHGADINAIDKQGRTPLHYLSQNNNDIDTFRYFLEHGAKINVIDKQGKTPLHYLAENSYDIDLFKYFIENGAKVDKSVVDSLFHRKKDDYDLLEIYNYLNKIYILKQATSEIPYLPPSKNFSGGKEYLKAKKDFESNDFGKKRNTFTSELKYLKRLK
jgi:ankyrin repeat protein